jgi:hypothetical protein
LILGDAFLKLNIERSLLNTGLGFYLQFTGNKDLGSWK